MNDFFQDLWHDLRAKRLLPVAAALLLAIVAIPVVLTESAAEPPPASPLPAAETSETRSLALDTESAASSGKGSELDVFTPEDPFTPPKAVTRVNDTATAAGTGSAKAGADEGKAGGTGGGDDDGSGGTGGDPSPEAPVAPPETSEYQYVADVTFWAGDRRSQRRLRKLDMLPNANQPVLIFMGATQDGGNAVFLVDSSLETMGEGSCEPSRANCVYVSVGPGAEQVFTDEEGNSYRLRVDEIRRVKVRAGAASLGGPKAHTSTGDGAGDRTGFNLPSLIDLVVETTAGSTGSSVEQDGR